MGKAHLVSMWVAFCFTQLNVIIGHAGYQMPFIPKWLPSLQAEYHDFHHVDYKSNFGAIYPFTDKRFGTLCIPTVMKVFEGMGKTRGYPSSFRHPLTQKPI